MANDCPSLVKDRVFIVCMVLQTIFLFVSVILVFVGCRWDRKKTKDEKERADRQRGEEERQKEIQREEDRQRADAEKIAVILSTYYYGEVENLFHDLKKTVGKFCEEKIVDDWTKFDALLYMCRPENWKNCNNFNLNREIQAIPAGIQATEIQATGIQVTGIQKTDLRYKLLSDVEIIMKFFLKCRIELFSIMQNKTCPDDIKLEFSTNITEMGKIIYPFVEKHRQDVIERVLKYFASRVKTHADVEKRSNPLRTRSFLLRQREGQETDADENIELLPHASTSAIESPNSDMPELIKYPGNAVLGNAIPYIKCFRYDETGMKLDFWWNMHRTMLRLLEQVELGKMQEEDEILKKIDELWRSCGHDPPGGGLLHSVRMIMFKQSENRDFFENHFEEFEQYVQTILPNNLSDDMSKLRCERMLDDIELSTQNLRKRERLLVLPETRAMLGSVKSQIESFCQGK